MKRLSHEREPMVHGQCPLGMSLNLETTVLVPHSALWTGQEGYRLYCRLRLLPRYIHCTVQNKLVDDGIDMLSVQTKQPTCEAKNCPRPRWQAIGKFCDEHYLLYWRDGADRHRARARKGVPHALASNTPRLLRQLASQTFQSQATHPKDAIQALLDSTLGCPNIYALDTEFRRQKRIGKLLLTEVAMINVRIGQLVHAVLDLTRIAEVLKKLHFSEARSKNQQSPPTKHVR